jgi:DNA end-binding protein Ku
MAPRSNWKGYLKLSLVSCPISIYPATSKKDHIAFHRINKETMNQLKQSYVDSNTLTPVESWQVGRGYEIAQNEFVLIDDNEIDDIKLESSKVINIDCFVKAEEIDHRWLDTTYYIVPNDKVGQDAFTIIRDSMKRKNVAGIGRVVMRQREHPLLIVPYGKGLMGVTMRYPYEVCETDAYFEKILDIPIPEETYKLTTAIIAAKTVKFNPEKFEDRFENALVELVRKKKGKALKSTLKTIAKQAKKSKDREYQVTGS